MSLGQPTVKSENFRIFADRVLVLPDAAPEKIGLIYVPDQAREKVTFGRVVAVGPGVPRRGGGMVAPVQVKKGDHVVYGEYAGSVYDFDDMEHKILRFDDIQAVLEEEEIAS